MALKMNIECFRVVAAVVILFYSDWSLCGCNGQSPVQRIGNQILGSMNYFSSRAREVVDLIFLVEDSLSRKDFDSELEFIKNILDHFSVAPQYTQVGVITFGNDAKVHISLDVGSKLDKCEVIKRLGQVGYRGGMTNMQQAFYLAKLNLDRARLTGRGALQVVFLLSDGHWNLGGDPKLLVDHMKKDNVEFVAVGVGWWQKSILNDLSSSDKNGKKLVYDIKTFQQFRDIARYFHKGNQRFEYKPVLATRCGSKCRTGAYCSCDARGGQEYKCVCDKGYHIKREGQIMKCAKCAHGTYSVSATTEKTCTACRGFTTTVNIGSTTLHDCICKEGFTNTNTAIDQSIDRTPPCKAISCPNLSRNQVYNADPWSCTNPMGFAHHQIGTVCKASCHQGYRATGSSTRECKENGKWSGTDLYCEQILCQPLQTPQNGRFSVQHCTTRPTARMTCQVNCNPGYEVQGQAMVFCKNDGTWSGAPGHCRGYQDSNDNLVLTLHYDYDCPDPSTQKQIKENAVSIFKGSSFGLICNCNITVDNFRVICGAINTSAVRGTPAPPRGKRSVGAPSLRGQNVELLMRAMKNALEKSAQTMGLGARYNVHGEVESCPPGQEYKQERNKCAVCVKGYFQNAALKCEKCPKGQYSEEERQVMCVACPDGESTLTTGSFSRQNCSEMCRRGYYSGNGLEYPDSCSPCPADTYNTARGQMSCKPCPRNTYTAPLGGADDRRKCKGACPAGTVSVDGLQPCKPCPKNTYQPNGRSTECQECPSGKVTVGEGKTRIGDCIDLNECLSNPCLNGARCEDRIDEYFCACPVGFTGKNCEVNIDRPFHEKGYNSKTRNAAI